MKQFLLVYDRSSGGLLDLLEFDDPEEAIRARFAREAELHNPNIEVVVLGAESREALHKTHGRYFGSPSREDLAAAG